MRRNDGRRMGGNRVWKGLTMMVLAAVVLVLVGLLVEHLWNWLLPGLFGFKTIGFAQAIGLLILSKILFGGFHGKGHGGRWGRHHMDERWANMSTEERERFRSGMRREWRACHRDKPSEPTAERTGL